MKLKPLVRSHPSVSRIDSAVTVIAALPRQWLVSSTESGRASRNSWAISSRPVASGTGPRPAHRPRNVDGVGRLRVDLKLGLDELLRAATAVARAPALVGLRHHHRAQLQDPVDERLGPRWAARD